MSPPPPGLLRHTFPQFQTRDPKRHDANMTCSSSLPKRWNRNSRAVDQRQVFLSETESFTCFFSHPLSFLLLLLFPVLQGVVAAETSRGGQLLEEPKMLPFRANTFSLQVSIQDVPHFLWSIKPFTTCQVTARRQRCADSLTDPAPRRRSLSRDEVLSSCCASSSRRTFHGGVFMFVVVTSSNHHR